MGRALAVALAVACAACSQEPRGEPEAVPEVTRVQASPVTADPVEAPPVTDPAVPQTTHEGVVPSTPVEVPSATDLAVPQTTHEGVVPSTPVEVPSATVEAVEVPSATAESVRPEWLSSVEGAAPGWPFHGVVQLWPAYDIVRGADGEAVGLELLWSLLYWSWDASQDRTYPRVGLPGLRIECLGQVALVHDERGVEVGGAPGAVNTAFRVPWGGTAQQLAEPSGALLAEAASRPSSVAVGSVGDWVRLGSGDAGRSYAMRDPVRPGGERWRVQARHDGELFMLTVHPAHLGCYSGVTWLSLAATGEFVMCGANSAATAFVRPAKVALGELVLPDPDEMGDYLSCAAQLDLYAIELAADRRLT